MGKTILLTGRPRVGKTTIIKGEPHQDHRGQP
jgi:hypothetical protein